MHVGKGQKKLYKRGLNDRLQTTRNPKIHLLGLSPNKLYPKTTNKPLGDHMEPMRLKIRKTASGTYYIPSLSIKQLRTLSKTHKRRWRISKNEKTLTPEGVNEKS